MSWECKYFFGRLQWFIAIYWNSFAWWKKKSKHWRCRIVYNTSNQVNKHAKLSLEQVLLPSLFHIWYVFGARKAWKPLSDHIFAMILIRDSLWFFGLWKFEGFSCNGPLKRSAIWIFREPGTRFTEQVHFRCKTSLSRLRHLNLHNLCHPKQSRLGCFTESFCFVCLLAARVIIIVICHFYRNRWYNGFFQNHDANTHINHICDSRWSITGLFWFFLSLHFDRK